LHFPPPTKSLGPTEKLVLDLKKIVFRTMMLIFRHLLSFQLRQVR